MKPTSVFPNDENDLVALLRLVARFRLVREDQLRAVLAERLPDLTPLLEQKIVLALTVPGLSGREQTVCALGRRGAEILGRYAGEEPRSFSYVTPGRFKRSLFTLDHELAVTDVGLALDILARDQVDLSLDSWETASQKIGVSTRIRTRNGLERVPLVADAFFGLAWNGNTSCFLLEVDRGTTGIGRMRRKFAGYLAWWRGGGPAERFGVKNLRLLVLAPYERRLKTLRQAASSVATDGGAGFFWFGLQEIADVSCPHRFLERTWFKADSTDQLHSLFNRRPGP